MYIGLLPLVHLFLQRTQKISKANPVKSCRSKSHPTAGIALVKIAATHSARRATPQSLGILALRPFWRHFFLAKRNAVQAGCMNYTSAVFE